MAASSSRSGHPLCLIRDSGTGNSHLLIGLATAAAEAGFRVKYALATKLVNELVEAADEKVLAKTIARYGRVDLICIDELGYMALDRRGAELLFQVLTEREEKNSVAIASNEWFSGWTKTFTGLRLCAGHRRPPHLRRAHHRDRHPVLPSGPHPGTPHQLSTCTNADRPAGWVLVVRGCAADLVLGMKQCLGQQGTDMAPA